MKQFSCEILTPEQLIFRGLVNYIDIDTETGYTGVYADHAQMVSVLTKGKVKVFADSQASGFSITGGFMHIKKNDVKILTPYAVTIKEDKP